MFDQLFDFELVLLEAVGRHALPRHVEFEHLSQFAVYEVLAGFEFAHSDSPLL
jgi:hypothetical protein